LSGATDVVPDAPVISAPDRRALTYRELDEHASRIVRQLNQLGVGRGDSVALVLPNGPEMAVAFLATAAGATCAPLNPAYRAHEFEFYLSDLAAKVLIVGAGLDTPARSVAAAQGIPVIELSADTRMPAGVFVLEGEAVADPVDTGFSNPKDIGLVLHTSGTTSQPKQVPLTHENLCASAANIQSALALTRADRCLNVMPLFHIHGLVGAVLSSVFSHASVVCTPGFDASRFLTWLAQEEPSWYTAVPTMHHAVLQAAVDRKASGATGLRFIRSSSAPLPSSLMLKLESVFDVPVIESYGMTEAAHQMASNPLPPGERKPGSAGIAAGPELAIIDLDGNFLDREVDGEIVIRGANVTAGYVGNNEANAAAFSRGWFRTGDLGRIDSDGYLFVTGRLKEMINRGGENVAPREVDDALLEHPGVASAVAFAVPHPTLGEDLAAAVVLNSGVDLTEQSLREHAFGRLTGSKVPSQIVFVDEIPKGPTGKLQRIGLHKRLEKFLVGVREPPGTELEALVAKYFAEILQLEEVGVTDNFFALGGDSLSATKIAWRVQSDFHFALSIVTVFENPTARNLAAEIDRLSQAANTPPVDSILDELEQLTDEEARRLLQSEE
jgi:acyl-CoA synthetase (AMP-forming)/AMP-acid ligase II/acyl carrier protein